MNLVKSIIKSLKPAPKDLRLVLICGVTGGGTTLISALMDQYLNSEAITHESQLHFPEGSPFKAYYVKKYPDFEAYRTELFEKFKGMHNLELFRKECIDQYKLFSGFNLNIKTAFDKSPNYHLVRAVTYHKAFKDIQFVVIFRDPKENVEGMCRKWPIFKEAGVEKMAHFWNDLFTAFLDFDKRENPKVIYINYTDLLDDSNGQLKRISEEMNIPFRKKIKPYKDKLDDPGKALRNVKNGEIVISKSHKQLWTNLNSEERDLIDSITGRTYEILKDKALKAKI